MSSNVSACLLNIMLCLVSFKFLLNLLTFFEQQNSPAQHEKKGDEPENEDPDSLFRQNIQGRKYVKSFCKKWLNNSVDHEFSIRYRLLWTNFNLKIR